MMDYKKAGVDIEAGYKSVELMKKYVKETMRPEVLGGLGDACLVGSAPRHDFGGLVCERSAQAALSSVRFSSGLQSLAGELATALCALSNPCALHFCHLGQQRKHQLAGFACNRSDTVDVQQHAFVE